MQLSEQKIREKLLNLGVNHIGNIYVFSSISSTNDFLLNQEQISDEVLICIADQQTRGRGRYGHHWVSPEGANLYLSVLIPLKEWSNKFDVLGLWLLISMAELLNEEGISRVQLKWPNDICVENKKLAGILVEKKTISDKQVLVIGVGLNILMSMRKNIPLKTPWIDLISLNAKVNTSRNDWTALIVSEICKTIIALEENRLINLKSCWQKFDMLINKQVNYIYEGARFHGKVIGISEIGNILVRTNDKELEIHNSLISDIKLSDKD